MGSVIKIKCNKCDIDNNLSIGTGMIYDPSLLGYKPAYCAKCEKYVSARVGRSEGVSDIADNADNVVCEVCGSPVVLKDIESDTTCDKCGDSLVISEIGMWD